MCATPTAACRRLRVALIAVGACARPLTALATVLYRTVTEWGCWADAISLAAGNAVAFLPQSRDVRTDAVDALFGPDPGTWIDLAILSQAGMSFVFLFLIGLGLRNRFRL